MKRLSVKEALLDFVEDTGDTLDINVAHRWARKAESAINSKRGYMLKSALRTVENCRITLPDDCVNVLMVLEGDYMDEKRKFSDLYMDSIVNNYTDDLDIEHCWITLDVTRINPALWEEYGNELIFTSEYEGIEVTLQYKAFEFGSDGYLIVNESHIEAIEAFVFFKSVSKYRHILFKREKIIRGGHTDYVNEKEDKYHRAVRNARAQDSKLTKKELYDLWNGRY
jgi:hypothetical protein